ncbi:MAG: sensor histidine kinase, partial [Geminicoccaceae bacterium]
CLNLSHELRTPAHAILGNVELMLSGDSGPLSAEMRAGLGLIQEAGFALLAMVDNILACTTKIQADPAHAPRIEHIASLLEQAWSAAAIADDCPRAAHGSPSRDKTSPAPSCWLRRLAILIDELQALGLLVHDRGDFAADACGALAISGLIDDAGEGTPTFGLLFTCPPEESPCLTTYLKLIDIMMALTGGQLAWNSRKMLLSWPMLARPASAPRTDCQATAD